ncbi:hypothetical protein HPB50_020026 [Hyalomma asiaticum]|uniref:Uncharacterized protein n=1 Tax=Hyalomma asiaticum TaxID=266040 RepID=A0ACB7SH98_HYAAI|nr:hypothetical protein HPB50_020026 [Hyalomma asiaticum]
MRLVRCQHACFSIRVSDARRTSAAPVGGWVTSADVWLAPEKNDLYGMRNRVHRGRPRELEHVRSQQGV